MCWWMCICVNKTDGWASVALQMRHLHGHVTAQEIQGYRWGPNPESEVIGQFLLHGVAVMLHWLVREAGGEGETQMLSGELGELVPT